MKTFEYKSIYFTKLKVEHYQEFDVSKLNELGVEGWELVSVGGRCVFKREIIKQSDQATR